MAKIINWQRKVEEALLNESDPNSHRELDSNTFHPSQLTLCFRQCYLSKLGINQPSAQLLGTFHVGTMLHEFMEYKVANDLNHLQFEKPLEKTYQTEVDGQTSVPIVIKGTCDCYDSKNEVVYDFKSRSSWYNFDDFDVDSERHRSQVMIYMDMLGIDKAQVVYVSKKNMEIKQRPKNNFVVRSQTKLDELLDKAEIIMGNILKNGFATDIEEIPFDKCGCFMCENEEQEHFTFEHLKEHDYASM